MDIQSTAQTASAAEFEITLRRAFSDDQVLYHQLVEARAKVCCDFYFNISDAFFPHQAIYEEVDRQGSVSAETIRRVGCQIVFSRRLFNEMVEMIIWKDGEFYYGFPSHFNTNPQINFMFQRPAALVMNL
jgi:hypothetical protein